MPAVAENIGDGVLIISMKCKPYKCPNCEAVLDRTNKDPDTLIYCTNCGCVPSSYIVGIKKGQIHDRSNSLSNSKTSKLAIQRQANLVSKRGQQDTIAQMWLDYARAQDQTEKNLAFVLSEILRIAKDLSLPKCATQRAAELCNIAFRESVTRGGSLSALATALVYASSKQCSLGITAEEIAVSSKVAKSEVVRCFRKIQRKLGLSSRAPSLQAHASRILELLSFTPECEVAVVVNELLQAADKNGVSQGKNPSGVVGACIYLAAKAHALRLTQKMIAQLSFVTESTIRNECKILSRLALDIHQKN